MSTFTTTTNHSPPFQHLVSGLFALLLLAVTALPAQAQDDDLPSIDFAVNVMQGAQILDIDEPDAVEDDAPFSGFTRIRAGVNASVQFSENVSALVMFQQEPNDFGPQFAPAIDFAILDLALSDEVTLRAGTPVTGLMNFRGYSDGPVVQGNPLIGNSPADMITAGQGVKLIGSFDGFGFDITVNRSFDGAVTIPDESNSGLNYIGKFRVTGSDIFKFGAGVAFQSGNTPLVFTNGDGDNYNLASNGRPSSSAGARLTHAAIPDEVVVHGDGKLTSGPADVDAWVGFATTDVDGSRGPFIEDARDQAVFGGLGVKLDVTEDFYVAGRYTLVENTSEDADDETTLGRGQIGIGVEVYDKALWKVEGVRQTEQDASFGKIGRSWYGVTTELSFNF